jgi:hypothetical protein
MMKPAASRIFLLRAVLGAMLGVVVLVGGTANSARAEDDDAWDSRMIRSILQTLGLRPSDESGIDYRERSPLVVPPNRNLVPPATAKTNEGNPAWPNDPDIKRRKEAKSSKNNQRRNIDWDAETRPQPQSVLRGTGTGTSVGQGQGPIANADLAGPMRPSELGNKGNIFSTLFGGPKEEYKTFTGETPRTSLIEPPTGYRTPSPNQPYGVGREKWTPAKTDRHEAIR